MDQEYPTFDEKIYDITNPQPLVPDYKPNDVTLIEQEKYQERIEIWKRLRTKDIKQIFINTVLIGMLGLLAGLLARLLFIPFINKIEQYSMWVYWIFTPIGVALFLLTIGILFYSMMQFSYVVNYLRQKSETLTKQGIKYGLSSLILLALYIISIITYTIYIISLLV